MSDFSNYNPISYEFNQLKQETLTELKSKSEWQNISEDDVTLQILLHILTAKESALFGMINNTFTDYFPNISSAGEATFAFADYIKMTIEGVKSSLGVVKFTIPSIYPKRILLPIKTEISNSAGDIIFSTDAAETIEVGELEKEVDVVQGQWKSSSNTSDGSDFQRYFIYEPNYSDRIIVKVNSVEWTRVDNFYFSTDADQHYVVKFTYDGLFVLFSDGTFSTKPQSGDTVEIEYLKSLGSNGNIFTSGIVNTIISDIYDIDTDLVEDISVNNDAEIIGGYDGDTLLDIQRNITRYFVTNPYITRKFDYTEYLKTNTDVIDVNIFAGWERFPNNKDFWLNVYIYTVPTNNKFLTETQKEELNDFIKLKDTFFTKIVFEDVSYIGIQLNTTIRFKDSRISQATINSIRNDITQLAEDYFDLEKAIESYGTVFRDIYHAEILEQIMDIDELRKANLNLQTVEEIEVVEDNDTSFNKFLEYQDIKLEETFLYLEDELVGTYNDSWVLVPIDNSGSGGKDWTTLISSTINYSSKSVTITILDPTITDPGETGNIVGDIFYIRSNPLLDSSGNEDDILAADNQVFEFYDIAINVEGLST